MELPRRRRLRPVRARPCRSWPATDIVPWGQEFHTVGHLYRSIQAGIDNLDRQARRGPLFIGPRDAQATPESFGWPQLIPITDADKRQQGHRQHRRAGRGRPGRLERGALRPLPRGPRGAAGDPGRRSRPSSRPIRWSAAGVRPVDGVYPRSSSPTRSPAPCPTCSMSTTTSSLQILVRFFANVGEDRDELGVLAHTAVTLMFAAIKPLGLLLATLPVGPEHPGVHRRRQLPALLPEELPAPPSPSHVDPLHRAPRRGGRVRRRHRRAREEREPCSTTSARHCHQLAGANWARGSTDAPPT